MNKTKLMFAVSSLLSITLILSVTLLYIEYKRLSEYRSMVTEVGHEVIEIRDTVTHYAISAKSDPYYLTRMLVNIEREAQAIVTEYQHQRGIGLYSVETYAQLKHFTDSLTKITDALDHVIGIIIVKESLLDSVTTHLSDIDSKDSAAARALLIDGIELLADDTSELGTSIQTFQKVEQQKQLLFSILLAHENMAFVEESEKVMTMLASDVRNLIIQLLFGFVLLVSVTIFMTYILRLKELKRNNLSYQEAIERTNRANEAKSIFLATMSHELRTPMNGVLGIAQIIQDESSEAHIREHASMIMTSGHHLVTLLNDVLDFSKVEQGKMILENKPFSINDVTIPLQQSLQPLADEKKIGFEITNALPSHLRLIGDSSRLRQILFNLAGNAIKFTSEGKVEVSFKAVEAPKNGIQVMVSDTGIGIARDKLEGIFTPFEQAELSTTRKFGGTGLGLSIVKQITELMGGEISVFSQPSVGSQFTLFLPLGIELVEGRASYEPSSLIVQSETEVKEPSSILPSTTAPRAMSVLLVDDNRVNAAVAEQFLMKSGHNISLAQDGVEAIDVLKVQRFDLIIMDNHMPKMSGVETIKFIRQELGLDTVIFAYTADVFKQAHDEFIQAGANFVLTKPLQKASLEKAIQQFHVEIFKSCDDSSYANNVVSLVRYPIAQLPLTEEEISHSSLLFDMGLSDEEQLELLSSLQTELDEKTELLFDAFSNDDTERLCGVVHSIKGTALEFGMSEMVSLAQYSESVSRSGQLPDVEELQKLINRMLVNSHQAHRLIEKLTSQQSTGS